MTSISVSWQEPDPPNGVINNYMVSDNDFFLVYVVTSLILQVSIALLSSMTDEIDDQNMTNISGTMLSFTFTNLMVSSNYQLNVTAYTIVGPGPAASLVLMTSPGGMLYKLLCTCLML